MWTPGVGLVGAIRVAGDVGPVGLERNLGVIKTSQEIQRCCSDQRFTTRSIVSHLASTRRIVGRMWARLELLAD